MPDADTPPTPASSSSSTSPSSVEWAEFTAGDARPFLQAPATSDDKYSRGVLGIMTGSPSFPGAAVLGVEAACRTGVGMVRYLGPGRATRLVLQRRPEVVTTDGRVEAWLVGSGMDAATREPSVTAALIEVLGQGHPVVIDAGALDLIGHATGPVVITPHAGELRTLLSREGVEVSRGSIASDSAHWASEAARMLGVTVLLKGHVTHTVAAPNGDARGTGLMTTSPTTELATAGSGDVLAGILGALVAMHAELVAGDGGALARLAAAADVVHGLAGARASGGGPIVALDIAEALPGTIMALRG